MTQQYPNPPLREVVCEFRFEEDGSWDGASPGLVYATLSNEFPRRLAVEGPAASPVSFVPPSNLLPAGVEHLELQVGPLENLRFWRESDELGHFSVAPYQLAIRHSRPYPSWEEFSKIVEKGVHAYREVLNPKKVKRIGLRYVNIVDLGQRSALLEEFFEFYPFVGQSIPQTLSRFDCRVQIDFEDARDSLTLRIGNNPRSQGNNAEIILDLDYFLVESDKFYLRETSSWLNTAHSNVKNVFEGCLKEPARALFR